MNHFIVDPGSPDPPFAQLRTQIAARVAAGDLAPGERLPTVRAMAGQVGLAVNTVARVYRELEADGVVTTEGRRGTFVTAPSAPAAVEQAAQRYASAARRDGLGLAEAVRLLERAW